MSTMEKPRGKHASEPKVALDEEAAVESEVAADDGSIEEEPVEARGKHIASGVSDASGASDDSVIAAGGIPVTLDSADEPDATDEPVEPDATDESAEPTGAEELDEPAEPTDAEAAEPTDADEFDEPAELDDSDESDYYVEPVSLPGYVEGEGATAYVAEFGEIPLKKRHGGLKAFGITAGVIIAVLLVVYIAGVAVFMGRMLPNTRIAGHDISFETDAAVCKILDDDASSYQLDIIGPGFAYRTDSAGIGLSVDSLGIVKQIHENLSAWTWPLHIFGPPHDATDLISITFNRSAYEADLATAIAQYNETAQDPVNATIVFDEKAAKFVVKPEEKGSKLDPPKVLKATAETIEALGQKLVLTDEQLVQPTVFADDEKVIEAAELATGMVSADLTLYLDGQPIWEVNGETLSPFISMDDKMQVVFKEDDLNAWVEDFANMFNTSGTERYFTRADGKEVVVPAGGPYGWEVDTEELCNALIEGIKAGKKADIEIPCYQTADVYNGPGQRDWGNRYIDVDLSEQYVRFYGDDGSIIWEADCISGTPDGTHDTGTGTWFVNAKESPSKLIGYENGKKIYETTVTYWMPFEGNGIGFHDATWQPSFGGNMYANGYGSHGCVNLSYNAAQSLYDIIRIGDCVVVHF